MNWLSLAGPLVIVQLRTEDMAHTTPTEEIQSLLATYGHALDDGRADDVVSLWEPDGVFELAGVGRFQGGVALREFYGGVGAPKGPQVHLMGNALITFEGDDDARVVSDFLLAKLDDGWSLTGRGRYHDIVHRGSQGWRFLRRSLRFE